jgi:hypothetical protein
MLKFAGYLLFITVLATACRSTKHIGAALARKDSATVTQPVRTGHDDTIAFIRSTLQQVQAHHIDYTTFTAKVNVDYKDATNKNYNVNATVRMYKDSAIWISANALLGIEALRALITKDSVKILDKLNKTYSARSMAFLQEVTDMPLTLQTMQDLIIGNPLYVDSVGTYARTQGNLMLMSIGPLFRHLLTLDETDATLLRSKIDNVNTGGLSRTADLSYSDYDTRRGFPFATKRQLYLSEIKKLDVKLEFRQFDVNVPVSFPFSIPKNYKVN